MPIGGGWQRQWRAESWGQAKAGVGMAETGHHCAETAGMGNNIPNIKMGDGWC